MKANKSGFIVCLVFTAIFLITGIVLICLPESEGFKPTAIALVSFFVAGMFGLISLATFFTYRKQQKRYAMIIANLAQMDCHAQLFTGIYGEKGGAGKAAAKSVLSALGGVLMALFFGFGAYKIYHSNKPMEYIVTDGGLFVGPVGSASNMNTMRFIANGEIPASIVVKKNCVIVVNDGTGEFYQLQTYKGGATSAQLGERLNAFAHKMFVHAASAEAAPAAAPTDTSETANTSAPADTAAPVDTAKDDPFGDL